MCSGYFLNRDDWYSPVFLLEQGQHCSPWSETWAGAWENGRNGWLGFSWLCPRANTWHWHFIFSPWSCLIVIWYSLAGQVHGRLPALKTEDLTGRFFEGITFVESVQGSTRQQDCDVSTQIRNKLEKSRRQISACQNMPLCTKHFGFSEVQRGVWEAPRCHSSQTPRPCGWCTCDGWIRGEGAVCPRLPYVLPTRVHLSVGLEVTRSYGLVTASTPHFPIFQPKFL